jgi:serine/threonine-protein kinase
VPKDIEPRRSSRRSSLAPITGSVPPPPLGGSRRFVTMLAAITFGVGALAVALRPRVGTLVVTVATQDGAPAKNVSVRIDGVTRCSASPCEVLDLEPGAHLVSAAAAGFPLTAERAVSVEAGKSAAEHVGLLPAADTEMSGLSVAAEGEGLHVFVDGRDLGSPPVSLHDVQPGSHTVRVSGETGLYEPYEQTLQLDRGEVRSLGPVRLHLLKGRLSLSAGDGADGAKIEVDGHPVTSLPTHLDLSPDEAHEVTATRPGFSAFEQQVVFDGSAERGVVVSLSPASGVTYAGARAVARNTPARISSSAARAAMIPSSSPATASGVATLDLNSIPRANVVVNGRPLGTTPLIGVHVPPGTQTIVFVHPTLGRKIASATVAAGSRKAAFVRF